MAKLIQNISKKKISLTIEGKVYELGAGAEMVVNTSKLSPLINNMANKHKIFIRYIDPVEIEERMKKPEVVKEEVVLKKEKPVVKKEEKVVEEVPVEKKKEGIKKED